MYHDTAYVFPMDNYKLRTKSIETLSNDVINKHLLAYGTTSKYSIAKFCSAYFDTSIVEIRCFRVELLSFQ